jgi:hypothetical protein
MPSDYVLMKARLLEEGEITEWKPTNISVVQRCDHTTTVCTECLPQWEESYVLRHNRISAQRLGRRVGIN